MRFVRILSNFLLDLLIVKLNELLTRFIKNINTMKNNLLFLLLNRFVIIHSI
jgi:hypothetical protein